MSLKPSPTLSRRDFTKLTGKTAAATALGAMVVPHVFAAEDNTINMALIGCGGRGTGAINNAFATSGGPLKLVAMADAFEKRLEGSYNGLKNKYNAAVDVPKERQFVGLDGYKHAMDALKPGDVAVFATPPAFRWVFFKYAIEKGLNVFLEKPVTIDGPTSKRMIALADEAAKKNLKVGVGLMCRHCKHRQELYQRIRNGEIGDLISLRCYREHGPVVFAFSDPKPPEMSHLKYQIARFHSFLWASGGLFSDFYIHNIDECCWMADKWPVLAQGNGGRHYKVHQDQVKADGVADGATPLIDQNFDSYNVEYTFDDGVKMWMVGRTINFCQSAHASYAHGTKGVAVISDGSHSPSLARIYKGQKMTKDNIVWATPEEEQNPYQLEWDDLMDAIRNNKPYNEVKRGVAASVTTSMGRMSCHTGQNVSYDQMLNCPHEFAPGLDQLTFDSPPPLPPLPDGIHYPVPRPGNMKALPGEQLPREW